MATKGKRSPTMHRTPEQVKAHIRGYQATPAEKKKRAKRNKARRIMEDAGLVRKCDGKEVNHKKMLSNGGSNSRSNLTVQPAKKNRAHGTSPGGSAPSMHAKKKRPKPTKKR